MNSPIIRKIINNKFLNTASEDIIIQINEFETRILGLPVYHIWFFDETKLDVLKFKQRLNEIKHPSLFVLRVQTNDVETISKITQLNFYAVDCLVYHLWERSNFRECENFNNVNILYACSNNQEEVAALSRRSFSDINRIRTRYSNDPLISEEKTEQIYYEWALKSVKREFANNVLISKQRDRVTGFLAYKISEVHIDGENYSWGEITLNAVEKEYSGRGIYFSLLNEALKILMKKSDFITLATQSDNFAAHRVCARLGSRIDSVFSTYHCWVINDQNSI